MSNRAKSYKPLPPQVLEMCRAVDPPPRLVAHLTLVHDVACRLLNGLQGLFPMLELDTESVLFGAATHDIGKAICTEELVAPGNSHEQRGANLLARLVEQRLESGTCVRHFKTEEQITEPPRRERLGAF